MLSKYFVDNSSIHDRPRGDDDETPHPDDPDDNAGGVVEEYRESDTGEVEEEQVPAPRGIGFTADGSSPFGFTRS